MPLRTIAICRRSALRWAVHWTERRLPLTDCRHVSRRVELDLLAIGETVVRVPTQLTGGARKGDREWCKSD